MSDFIGDWHALLVLLVAGVPLGQNAADHFVLPGVADLNTGTAAWRTDTRIFIGETEKRDRGEARPARELHGR